MDNEIGFLESKGLNIWNIDNDKRPCMINNTLQYEIEDWQNYTEKDFKKLKVDYKKNIGFYSGYQYKSKLYIIVLNFDIFDKGVKNDMVEKLYNTFVNIDKKNNTNLEGHYDSSTCGNKGVLLDITDNIQFIEYLESFHLTKITGGLEILIKNNVVLPPSITTCKNCNTLKHYCKFLTKAKLSILTPEIETFLKHYINTEKRKKPPTKHDIRDTRNAKNGVIHYSNVINTDDNIPEYKCILELVNTNLKTVLNDYQGWFFITSSLINSYGNTIENFKLFDEICKPLKGYDYQKNLNFWNTIDISKYKRYSYKAIIKVSYMYDELKTYCILGNEYKNIQKIKISNNEEYESWKAEFELTHAKILSPLNFLDIVNNTQDFISQQELKQRYAENHNFIEKWLKDDKKRNYKKLIFKPNATEEENKQNYNLFNGYYIEKSNESIDDTIDITPLIEFINLISGNSNYKNIDYKDTSFIMVMAYIIKIVKYKARPKISLILRSVRRQGCGKGTFYNLLKKLIGDEYCIETSNINDLFGNFNDSRVNKILIAVDECAGNETFQFTGKLKNAITEDHFTANPKYGKKYELANYNSFLFFSNNEKAINVEVGNRRFWVIDVPNAQDNKFLIDINQNYINNDKIMKAFYYYLVTKAEILLNINVDTFNFENIIKNKENKSTKNLKQTHIKDLFFTNFYENIIEKQRQIRLLKKNENISIEAKLETIIRYNNNNDACIINALDLYNEYNTFLINSNIVKNHRKCSKKCIGICCSNQTFYNSLDFYDFLKSYNLQDNDIYIFDIPKYKEWYNTQEDNSNLTLITDDELEKLGF